jgi:hypothetical protein
MIAGRVSKSRQVCVGVRERERERERERRVHSTNSTLLGTCPNHRRHWATMRISKESSGERASERERERERARERE